MAPNKLDVNHDERGDGSPEIFSLPLLILLDLPFLAAGLDVLSSWDGRFLRRSRNSLTRGRALFRSVSLNTLKEKELSASAENERGGVRLTLESRDSRRV